jgi:hypothetical protein
VTGATAAATMQKGTSSALCCRYQGDVCALALRVSKALTHKEGASGGHGTACHIGV